MLCQLVLQEKCCMQLFCGVQGITHSAWHLLAPLMDITFARDINPLVEGVKSSAFTSRRWWGSSGPV